MRFEWDEPKRQANLRKHGLDFSDAPEIFLAPMLTRADARHDYGEDRFVGIGFLRDIVVAVAFTEPSSNVTRVVSLRKALSHEQKLFEAFLRDRLG